MTDLFPEEGCEALRVLLHAAGLEATPSAGGRPARLRQAREAAQEAVPRRGPKGRVIGKFLAFREPPWGHPRRHPQDRARHPLEPRPGPVLELLGEITLRRLKRVSRQEVNDLFGAGGAVTRLRERLRRKSTSRRHSF